MERLTFEGNFCDIAQCSEVPGGSFCEDGSCSQKKVWERLKAYEDKRLEPEEVLPKDKADEIALKLMRLADLESICSYTRLREFAEADKDGRVVVLPCKLGTKVYRIRYEIADYPDDPDLEIADTWFTPEYRDDIGKTVFLTREEAERAMQEMEGRS